MPALALAALAFVVARQKAQKPPAAPTPPPSADAAPAAKSANPAAQSAKAAPTAVPSAAIGVFATPNPALPGQTVVFYLPPRTVKVRAIGGGFGAGQDFTNAGPLSTTVWKTTPYAFKVWVPTADEMRGSRDSTKSPVQPTGGHRSPAAQSGAAPGTAGLRMSEYRVTVAVAAGRFPGLATYLDWRHWKVDVVEGWNRYVVTSADPANHGLIYFEPSEDSPERLAVSVATATGMTSTDLMRKVKDEVPTEYDTVKAVAVWPTRFAGESAMWMRFEGIDRAQPDILTESDVLAVVRDGKGYVVSARTQANRYAEEAPLLDALVRSFAILPPDSEAAQALDEQRRAMAAAQQRDARRHTSARAPAGYAGEKRATATGTGANHASAAGSDRHAQSR